MEVAHPAQVKSCCAALYEMDWVKLLLGDSFHPGGLRSTDGLARLLDITAADTVLDLACGRGSSALYLAEVFGCSVIGIDLSEKNIAAATARARDSELESRVTFHVGDGEAIPLDAGSVSVVMCECAFCTFPAKERAARELARVLRPGGRAGLADLTRTRPLPATLDGLLSWVACIADARPIDEYLAYLQTAGLGGAVVQTRDHMLTEMVATVRQKLLGAELLVKLGMASLPVPDVEEATSMARAAMTAVRDGHLGYAFMAARKVNDGKGLEGAV